MILSAIIFYLQRANMNNESGQIDISFVHLVVWVSCWFINWAASNKKVPSRMHKMRDSDHPVYGQVSPGPLLFIDTFCSIHFIL